MTQTDVVLTYLWTFIFNFGWCCFIVGLMFLTSQLLIPFTMGSKYPPTEAEIRNFKAQYGPFYSFVQLCLLSGLIYGGMGAHHAAMEAVTVLKAGP